VTSIQTVVQTPVPGEAVFMFRLDATSVGGSIIFFCQGRFGSTGVTFGGQYYTPADIEFSDFETTSAGSLPTPKMKLSNTNGVFQSMINTYGDMTGCIIQRIRTFRRFLDGQEDADPTAYYGPDTFKVERKSAENPVYIEWELSAAIDQEGKLLPGRQVIRDTCLWRYRRWNSATNAFDYSKAQCSHTGNSFDLNNNPTTSDKDICNRHISGCKVRFGANNPLYFGGFPGAARIRQ
jgi:lambda family phage minor tail protein L